MRHVWEQTEKQTKTKTLDYIFHDEGCWDFSLQCLFMLPAYYHRKVFKAQSRQGWRLIGANNGLEAADINFS